MTKTPAWPKWRMSPDEILKAAAYIKARDAIGDKIDTFNDKVTTVRIVWDMPFDRSKPSQPSTASVTVPVEKVARIVNTALLEQIANLRR